MKLITTMKNHKLLTVVIMTYLLLLLFMPTKAIEAFQNSLYYVKEMLIIMPVILLLTSLIEAWVPKHLIESALGENAGFKGYILAFLLGSFSAGPIYAAFPVCKTLLNKGARIPNIIIILSSWAVIKIPMLANEAQFLGAKFMIMRWLLTTVAIFIMAYLIGKLIKPNDLVISDSRPSSELTIQESYCIGCGVCARLDSQTFAIQNKKAILLNTTIDETNHNQLQAIASKCPAKAIILPDSSEH